MRGTSWTNALPSSAGKRVNEAIRLGSGVPKDASQASWGQLAADNLDVGLACFDREGRLTFMNPYLTGLHPAIRTHLRISRRARDIAMALARSRILAVEHAPRRSVADMFDSLSRGRHLDVELADGRWLELAPVIFAEGVLVRVSDISSRKSAELSLTASRDASEDANAKKSRFLRAANHDLRQPLATLKILIYSSFVVEDDDKRLDLLHSMDVTVGIMDEILTSLLQIGQLDAGRIVPRVVHFQISQVISRLKIEFQPQAEAKGLRFRAVTGRVTVQTDRALLERILSNLVANAIRFTETGGVLVGVRRRGDNARIEVWDSGCGIPEDQIELIFDEFHQVEAEQMTRQRGLGLGLNIAMRLGELLGHRICVASVPGKGSTFSVELPLGDLWRSDLGEPEINERIGGEFLGVRLLLIEDNEMLRATVATMLERWGVKVITAGDGASALALFEGPDPPDPDIALVDYRLPNGRAGTEVLADLRLLLNRDLAGIVATADNDPDLINEIRAQGLPVLIKPVIPARLRSAMHHLLYEQNHSKSPSTP